MTDLYEMAMHLMVSETISNLNNNAQITRTILHLVYDEEDAEEGYEDQEMLRLALDSADQDRMCALVALIYSEIFARSQAVALEN